MISGDVQYHRQWRKRTKNWDVTAVKERKRYAHVPKMMKLVQDSHNKRTDPVRSHKGKQ